MKTTTVGVLGSLAINVALALLVAAVFSVTPVAHAREVAQCPDQKAAQPAAPAEHERAGGHLAAVRMGWEAS
jgi:methionine-rich copper-binding protein CopC